MHLSGASGAAEVTWARTMFAVRQQPLAVDIEQIGQQLEPAAIGEHDRSFASGGCTPR